MVDSNTSTRIWNQFAVCMLVLASALIFWKIRIFDLGINPAIGLGPIDLYIEHTPMAQAAYQEFAQGRLPLWNPYQLCGLPFLAVPHLAAFYPLHLYSLFVDATLAVEISFVLHMFLGGSGMWFLVRRFGFSALAASASAVTFMWSGWIVFSAVLPGIFASLNWLPMTILMLDRSIDRARLGHTLLIAAITSQILLGATEILLHTLYVGAAFTTCRLALMAWNESAARAAQRGGSILVAMAAAALIASPQLLPSIELVFDTGRGSSSMSFAAAAFGAISPLQFIRQAIGVTGLVTVGVLPFLAIPLGFEGRPHRFTWLFALGLALIAALLVFGGVVYHAYYSLPVVGDLFRRPMKFLDIYAFGQALFAGLAVAQLQVMASWPRKDLWRSARWLACLLIATAAFAWTRVALPVSGWPWFAALVLLLAFGTLSLPQWRNRILIALVVVQAVSLFLSVGNTRMRPVKRPEIYHTEDALLEKLRQNVGGQRVHLSSQFTPYPGLTAKQGLLSRLRVSSDYETLAPNRYARFFGEVTPKDHIKRANPFAGIYSLSPESRFRLMDLTSTRYYVMAKNEPASQFMRSRPKEFERILSTKLFAVFERSNPLPRAFLVPNARLVDDPEEVLSRLTASDFDPRREVLLEQGPTRLAAPSDRPPTDSAAIVVDGPDEVVVRVSTSRPTFLVLNDLFYPGWRAFVEGREVKIYRANYLFRAIQIDPGRFDVRFVYEPTSFRLGLALSAATLAALIAGPMWRRRRVMNT